MRSTRLTLAAALALLTGSAQADPAADSDLIRPTQREPPPGEGTICALGLYSAAEEVGKRCFAGEDPEVQAELARAVARLDAFVLANSDMGPAGLERFKREQSLVGAPEAQLCSGDPVAIYKDFARQGAETIRIESEKATARPGPATWGDCL